MVNKSLSLFLFCFAQLFHVFAVRETKNLCSALELRNDRNSLCLRPRHYVFELGAHSLRDRQTDTHSGLLGQPQTNVCKHFRFKYDGGENDGDLI